MYFYPRSPCGERHHIHSVQYITLGISIHALLAESDTFTDLERQSQGISIHALLAESDGFRMVGTQSKLDFYPRSPCGERLSESNRHGHPFQFLSTLSLRRATTCVVYMIFLHTFLSTLSLRRATSSSASVNTSSSDFYPRSPCGERPTTGCGILSPSCISIHALLAESDFLPEYPTGDMIAFLSTLSLRRATLNGFAMR